MDTSRETPKDRKRCGGTDESLEMRHKGHRGSPCVSSAS